MKSYSIAAKQLLQAEIRKLNFENGDTTEKSNTLLAMNRFHEALKSSPKQTFHDFVYGREFFRLRLSGNIL